jgi:ribosome-binding factor A
MNTRRTAKVAAAVRQVVSSVILFELRDPRVKQVTVLRTEVAEDLRTAKVFVSVLGDETEQRLAVHGLNSARGFIQSRIADELQLRLTPVLSFVLDQGVKKSIEVSRALRAMQPEGAIDAETEEEPASADEEGSQEAP